MLVCTTHHLRNSALQFENFSIFKGPNNFCDYIQNRAFMYDEIMACSKVPAKNVCPWPVDSFALDKCLIPIDKIPKYLSGEYRVDCEVMKGDETLGGYQVFFNVISLI